MLRAHSVTVTPLSESDLLAIRGYLAVESVAIADLVHGELLKAIASLKRVPERFPLARQKRLRAEGIRATVAVSYRIYFVVDGPDVRVLRVWHVARKPPPVL